MNIFYLDKCPYKAAELQYNKHVVKMILESAQMLCTAHHHYAEKHEINADYIPYKKAHYNHPSTIWCRQNKNHYRWLYNHMIGLGQEYTDRYNKEHLSITNVNLNLAYIHIIYLKERLSNLLSVCLMNTKTNVVYKPTGIIT